MFEPVKVAFGAFMGGYYAALVPTTKALQGYVTRGLGKAILWAPARMVDAAEEMLASWQRNDTDQATTRPPDMPVIIVAMARDTVPTGRDFTRQLAEREYVILPDDPQERAFGLRTIAADIRAQVAIFAHDEPTARSLAAQLIGYLDAAPNRRMWADYPFAGFVLPWPVQVETPEVPAMAIPTEAKNLTILVVDLTLKATVPLYDAPGFDEPNDGQGDAETGDPPGYPVTVEVATDGRAVR